MDLSFAEQLVLALIGANTGILLKIMHSMGRMEKANESHNAAIDAIWSAISKLREEIKEVRKEMR